MSHIGLKVHGSIAQNNLIKNNIVHTAATQLVYEVDGSSNTINYNLYYDATLTNKFKHDASTYSTLADWRTASGQDANSPSVADPLFISTVTPDFHLQSGSPAINAGVDVGLTEDYLGNPVPYLGGKVDIGAYEFQSGDPWAIGGGGRFPSFPTFPSFPSWR
jgi:hypothetical protein